MSGGVEWRVVADFAGNDPGGAYPTYSFDTEEECRQWSHFLLNRHPYAAAAVKVQHRAVTPWVEITEFAADNPPYPNGIEAAVRR